MTKCFGWRTGIVVAVLLAAPAFAHTDVGVWSTEPSSEAAARGGVIAASDTARKAKGSNNVVLAEDEAPRVAVTEFDDKSHARIDHLGSGFADKLADRLTAGGVHIVGRGEMDSLMQEEGLDPTSLDDLSLAARELGVDLLVTGTVESFVIDTTTLDLGLVRLTSAEARVDATAELIDPSAGAIALTSAASGSGKGSSGLSVSLGSLFPTSPSCDVCGGGLRVERTAYAQGELVSLGVLNTSSSGWFGVEVAASDGTFVRWLGWHFVTHDTCETWFWNQRDALGSPVGAAIYTVRLRDGDTLLESVSFEVRPSVSFTLPSLDEVTVGTTAFDSGVAGLAINDAVSQLAASLLSTILAHGAAPALGEATPSLAGESSPLLGQVASVFPDGRMAINIGASSGVAVGDRFEVLAVDHLAFDPDTLAIVAYDVLETKGEIEIVEVRDRASTGVRLGEFDPLVGDLVRFVP